MDIMVSSGGPDRVRHLVIRAPDDATEEQAAARLCSVAEPSRAPREGSPLLHGARLGEAGADGTRAAGGPADSALASVVVLSGPDAGRWVDLPPGRWVSIGRDPTCDLTVEDRAVSRVHVRVRHERDQFLLEDLGSTNGVLVDPNGDSDREDATDASDATDAAGRPGHWRPGQTLLVGTTRLSLVSQTPAPLALTPRAGRLEVRPWPGHLADLPAVELSSPAEPVRREVRAPSAWTWSLPMVIGLGVALALRMPWLMLFGLLGPAMIFGQYLGDRRSARLEHEAAVAAHEGATVDLERDRRRALADELAARREHHPGVAGIRAALVPRPSVRLWSAAPGPPRVVIGEGTVASLVTVDETPQPLEEAPVTLVLDHPVVVVGPPVLRDAAVRSWVLQAATTHQPRGWAVVVDVDAPPPGWDLLAWLPHTTSDPSPQADHRLVWGRDLVLVDDLRDAPSGIPRVVVLAQDRAVLQRPGEEDVHFRPTLLSHPTARGFARRLAPLTDGSAPGPAGPAPRTLGDLVPWPADAAAAMTAWDGQAARLRVPMGLDPAGQQLEIDLAADGPHALVAGTTGSGKSELLRTLVTGLALRNGPDRLTFLLIDYKGGSSLGECAALPHSTGLVTDLDPNLAQRVLTSLQAELRRRESVLAASGARDVAEHAGTDLPRLVIVIDEFRVLREELPAFLDGLIRVAAVGRSLGLHLVLATQRPAGVVTADLRANVNLRIALRLRDESDSRDVIEAPDAALLPEGRPGAALIRTGSAAPRAVQVVPTGPPSPSTGGESWSVQEVSDAWAGLRHLHRSGADTSTPPSTLGGLPAVLQEAALAEGRHARRVWLPALPEVVTADHDDLDRPGAWALADRPELQSRESLVWSGRHNVAVVGAARTGRSTMLAAVARSVGPAWVYVLALGSGLGQSGLGDHPGLRAWVAPDDVAGALRVLEVLADLVDARRTEPEQDQERAPVVLVLDGWDRWVERAGEVESGRGVELALRVLREGPSAGVCCLVSGDRSILLGKVAAAVPETWALRLNDPSELTLSGLRREQIPVDPPPGRAVRLRDGLVAQVVLPGDAAPPSQAPPEPPPARVRPLPHPLTEPGVWAVGGDDAAPLPPVEGSLLVLGPPRSGVTSTLHRLSGEEPGTVVVAGPGSWTDPELARALSEGPGTVVVDEAHLLAGTATEDLVLDWARQGAGRLLVGGELEASSAQFRGLVHHLARHRRGIVLQPSAPRDGHVLGMALPVGDPRVPGRGVLVDRGRAVRIQVATAP